MIIKLLTFNNIKGFSPVGEAGLEPAVFTTWVSDLQSDVVAAGPLSVKSPTLESNQDGLWKDDGVTVRPATTAV